MKGGLTGRLEAEKELKILEEQLAIAKAKGDAGQLDAKLIQNQIDAVKAGRALFRADTGVDRARSAALLRGDRLGAQALDDNRELQKLRDQYVANGLTTAQADKDFKAALLANAMAQGPRLVADSLQSVGGGGGYSQASPMAATMTRIEKLEQTQAEYLRIIASNAGSGLN